MYAKGIFVCTCADFFNWFQFHWETWFFVKQEPFLKRDMQMISTVGPNLLVRFANNQSPCHDDWRRRKVADHSDRTLNLAHFAKIFSLHLIGLIDYLRKKFSLQIFLISFDRVRVVEGSEDFACAWQPIFLITHRKKKLCLVCDQ